MTQPYDPAPLQAFADQLDDVAEALPIEQAMTKDQAKQLMSFVQALGGAASNLRLIAVQQILADTTASLANISDATQKALDTIKTITAISRVITVVGDIVVLAQVVATQKWPLVLPALKGLQKDTA